MKLQASDELPLSQIQTGKKSSKFVCTLIALTFIITVIPLYFPDFPFSHKKLFIAASSIGHQHLGNDTLTPTTSSDPPPKPNRPHSRPDRAAKDDITVVEKPEQEQSKGPTNGGNEHYCDLFTGVWVPNPEGPYYTNLTCNAIQGNQNCMKFGRPDTSFLKWRWKPDGCELPVFNPHRFLQLMRGKSLAFVGDSVARNHMQSLLCLLSRVAVPVELDAAGNKLYLYSEYNFNISNFFSPYLVRTERIVDISRPFNVFLDEFDETWTTKIETFDYVIISGGHWFFHLNYFYLSRTLIGCLHCPESNVTHLTPWFSYRLAFRTAFRAINGAENFRGAAFLRTFSPSHFEGGAWNNGGNCVRTTPYKRNEKVLENYMVEIYRIQVEEMRMAEGGGRLRLFDATKAMTVRPDGHPSKYGHWEGANRTFYNDCVHWCLPGPIDAWNDMLQELLKREVENYG